GRVAEEVRGRAVAHEHARAVEKREEAGGNETAPRPARAEHREAEAEGAEDRADDEARQIAAEDCFELCGAEQETPLQPARYDPQPNQCRTARIRGGAATCT